MEYVILAAVIAGFAIVSGRIWFIRYRDGPLRREVRARDVIFRAGLDLVRIREDPGGLVPWDGLNAPMALYVRGDAIEISSTFAPFRVVMGMEYYFKVHETWIEMSRSPSLLGEKKKNWIVVTGRQLGKEVQLAIGNNNDRRFPEIWNALVEAGATPVGLPPQEKPAGAWGVP